MTHRKLTLPKNGRLHLLVVSDSHSAPCKTAMAAIRNEPFDACIHAGDIGYCSEIEALTPFLAVRGNCDASDCGYSDDLIIEIECEGEVRARILVCHVGVYGIKLRSEVLKTAKTAGAGLVICGHSHMPLLAQDRGVAIFNPGSIGPRRAGLPITYGYIDITENSIDCWHMNGETGERWVPPMYSACGLYD